MKPVSVAALAITLAAAGPAFGHDTDMTAWRLFVSDHSAAKVTAIDALKGRRLATFDLKGPASLYRSESGETVFAVQGSAGVISAIGSGIMFRDHGDHGDIEIEPAKLLTFALSGTKPAHFVERQGKVAQWFDGEDSVRLLSEDDVLAGKSEIRTVNVGKPHHGVAVPFDNHAVVTIPNPDDPSKRPIGARIVGHDGRQIGGDVACPGLHGSAGSGSLYALACETGLLLVSQSGTTPEIKHLPYGASLPKGSSSTLIGGKGLQYFIGNFGPDRILIVDPSETDGFRLVQLPTRRVHFAVDPIRSRFAYVVTEDGQLHQIDVLEGAIAKSVKLTEPYSMDGHWSDPRPRVAVAGDRIFVSDPLKSRLLIVDAATFARAGEVKVEGKPFNLVAVGGSGKVHGKEEHVNGHKHKDKH